MIFGAIVVEGVVRGGHAVVQGVPVPVFCQAAASMSLCCSGTAPSACLRPTGRDQSRPLDAFLLAPVHQVWLGTAAVASRRSVHSLSYAEASPLRPAFGGGTSFPLPVRFCSPPLVRFTRPGELLLQGVELAVERGGEELGVEEVLGECEGGRTGRRRVRGCRSVRREWSCLGGGHVSELKERAFRPVGGVW